MIIDLPLVVVSAGVMAASCDALLLACSHRRAARREPQAQRMERAA